MAAFETGYSLVAVDLPERAMAGETLELTFTWHSDQNGETDHIQFLHIGQRESGEWQVFDQMPLGARLPTRLWYAGLVDEFSWL